MTCLSALIVANICITWMLSAQQANTLLLLQQERHRVAIVLPVCIALVARLIDGYVTAGLRISNVRRNISHNHTHFIVFKMHEGVNVTGIVEIFFAKH